MYTFRKIRNFLPQKEKIIEKIIVGKSFRVNYKQFIIKRYINKKQPYLIGI